MKHMKLVGVCAVVAFAAAPGAADAFPRWEVRVPGPWAQLPIGAVERVTMTGTLAMNAAVGGSPTYNFKDVCTVNGEESIFNPPVGRGQDQMQAFTATCPPNGTPPEPCATGESFTLTGGKWPSVLRNVGPTDEFKFVEMQIECASSVKGPVLAVTGSWSPKISINKFTFTPASGAFESANTEFVFMGSLKLKPTSFAFVRG